MQYSFAFLFIVLLLITCVLDVIRRCLTIKLLLIDLRDDKQFFVDHPGAVPISTAQGEELRKLIGAAAYIECSSKTQQVLHFILLF
jgi:hypothetical protein